MAWNGLFSLERRRARYESEPVNHTGDEDDNIAAEQGDNDNITPDENGQVANRTTTITSDTNHRNDGENLQSSQGVGEENNGRDVEEARQQSAVTVNPVSEAEDDDILDDLDDDEHFGMVAARTTNYVNRTGTMTLAELEEERELARRRSSACVLLSVFVLFRLWVECLQAQDLTLLMLCLLGTTWTARWIQYNREREEELDRRIEQYLRGAGNSNGDEEGGVVDRNELRMLSFQAQLALAIMESQRHMMEGGRPDAQHSPGVSDEAKTHWTRFKYKAKPGQTKGDYGSVTQKDTGADNYDLPHCSICLSEYEDGEALVNLPCGHVFHEECINSWTESHQKCPLCNHNLESVTGDDASTTAADDSMV